MTFIDRYERQLVDAGYRSPYAKRKAAVRRILNGEKHPAGRTPVKPGLFRRT